MCRIRIAESGLLNEIKKQMDDMLKFLDAEKRERSK